VLMFAAVVLDVIALVALTVPTMLIASITLCYAVKLCMNLRGDTVVIVQMNADNTTTTTTATVCKGGGVVLQTCTIPVAQVAAVSAQPVL
jgi:hypothetical protein